ncbi:MAG TPA: 1-phosphofructokinase family hexose kinase [Solirubrobacterales bacterium]
MILTVTLNAAIDRTVAVPNFHLGHRHRAVEARTVAGGKGVNVARALKLLGRPVIATGLSGGPTGSRILERLAEESILNDFTQISEESRTNLAVVDPTSGQQTEINERGPAVAPEELERFIEKLLYLAQGAEFCVVAGSVPPGLEPGVYGRLVSELRGLGVPTLLDTDGEPMRLGLRAGPDVVAPNELEAEQAVGHEFSDAGDLALGLGGLLEMGAHDAIVTRANGCVAILGENGGRRRYEVEIEPLDPVATVGSGDAFVAGYISARFLGAHGPDALAYGVACGAESTQHFGAGEISPAEVERLLSKVQVRELEVPAPA